VNAWSSLADSLRDGTWNLILKCATKPYFSDRQKPQKTELRLTDSGDFHALKEQPKLKTAALVHEKYRSFTKSRDRYLCLLDLYVEHTQYVQVTFYKTLKMNSSSCCSALRFSIFLNFFRILQYLAGIFLKSIFCLLNEKFKEKLNFEKKKFRFFY
jgi:hypothetical protein